MFSAIIISNYWGVAFFAILFILTAFVMGFIYGYETRIRDVARDRMSREWSMRNHPTYNGDWQ
jgi:preprotein translocase subunit SecG